MPTLRRRDRAEDIDDRELAAFLAGEALLDIRALAIRAKRQSENISPAEALDRINEMADFCRDMLGISRPTRWRPSRGIPSRRERAMLDRPMSYRWNTCGPERRAWILRHIDRAGYRWTPPPPLPTPRKEPPALTMRQRFGLVGWPVKTPPARRSLPRSACILKALDTEAVLALYEEAGRLRLGLGSLSPWLRAHLDPDATHYLFPDPADYYWPDPDAGRRWWQCRALLRMVDGEQVRESLAVVPETFVALPSTLPRLRQRRLAHVVRLTERDAGLWGRDHNASCAPESCGYPPAETS